MSNILDKNFKAIVDKINEVLTKLDKPTDPALFQLQERGTIEPFDLSPTAAGQQNIVTPTADKALKVLMWFYYCDSDIITEIVFSTSNIYVAGLPTKGCCGLNSVGRKPPQGATGEPLTMKYSGGGVIRGWVCVEEV